uniref:Uncharacterized protein n=1 Tax=Serinus canaria TaxID=9135 RepID=A0A8C9MQ81_SERCA
PSLPQLAGPGAGTAAQHPQCLLSTDKYPPQTITVKGKPCTEQFLCLAVLGGRQPPASPGAQKGAKSPMATPSTSGLHPAQSDVAFDFELPVIHALQERFPLDVPAGGRGRGCEQCLCGPSLGQTPPEGMNREGKHCLSPSLFFHEMIAPMNIYRPQNCSVACWLPSGGCPELWWSHRLED